MNYRMRHADPSPAAAAVSNRSRLRLGAASIAALTIFVLFYNLGDFRSLRHPEAFVAVPAREMMATGDWVVPRFAGIPRLTKPPLSYWTVAGVSWLLGGDVTAWTTRLPSAIAGALLVLLVGMWARRWYGAGVGLCAALAQATAVYFILQTRLGKVDVPFALLTTLALYLAAGYRRDETNRKAFCRWIAFYALLGLSVLAKGPLGPALVLAPCGLCLLLQWKSRFSGHLLNPIGLLVFAGLVFTWPCLISSRVPEVWMSWHLEYMGRVMGECASDESIWYYFPVLLWLNMPWTPFAGFELLNSWRRAWREKNANEQFLWCWLLGQVILLSISRGKDQHFLLPTLPAISLLAGRALARCLESLQARQGRLMSLRGALVIASILGAGCLAAGIALMQAWPLAATELFVASLLTALGIGVMAGFSYRSMPKCACGAGISLIVLWCTIAFGWIIPKHDASNPAIAFVQSLDRHVPAGESICFYKLGETRLHFYVRQPVVRDEHLVDMRLRWKQQACDYILTPCKHVEQLRQYGDLELMDILESSRHGAEAQTSKLVLLRFTPRPRTITDSQTVSATSQSKETSSPCPNQTF